MKSSLSIKGIDQLVKHLDKAASLKDVQQVVKSNGAQLTTRIQKYAVFRGHYEGKKFVKPTGFTKRSVILSLSRNNLEATTGPTSDYGGYLEVGTRFMGAQPFVKPAFDIQKKIFINDLKELLK
ncbi:HK97-gp10 family putative phage morphogenesis protein [Lactococcus cremoris]|uniref:HK97-gp10 family putative phage morphogenesis protein n=1 Tax=Lactococcus lactis subsp. cremoris TaxID=1359 RepID=UPI002182284B|nr:HK97-gp10 family putative phage morphogenesis protein [Lactococcus cremoris]MCT0447244.1 HK97 gp10 family phage protein [Lactococcus cremoris]MCT0453179.1 HK97 gp10 family phage protein [Lactococcus cremoris]WJQ76144.1 HK97 gp10 family phage protein [Lactococcus cremoris]